LWLHFNPTNALWEADGGWFDDSLSVPGVATHAVVSGGIGIVVGMAICAEHAVMVAICAMHPAVWFAIPVGDVICSSSSVHAAVLLVGLSTVASYPFQ